MPPLFATVNPGSPLRSPDPETGDLVSAGGQEFEVQKASCASCGAPLQNKVYRIRYELCDRCLPVKPRS